MFVRNRFVQRSIDTTFSHILFLHYFVYIFPNTEQVLLGGNVTPLRRQLQQPRECDLISTATTDEILQERELHPVICN